MVDRDIDASILPTYTFGMKSVNWWGSIGLIAIEGTMTLLCVVSYFYLRSATPNWPPPPTPVPDQTLGVVNSAILVTIFAVTIRTDLAARKNEQGKIKVGLALTSFLGLVLCLTRYYEFFSLNTRWDLNAYGSAVWTLLAVHYSHILSEVVETAFMTSVFLLGYTEGKNRSNVSDSCLLWYFIVAIWAILYPVIYLTPFASVAS